MKLATLKNGTLDGRLVVVSRDLTKAVDATSVAPNMLTAVQDWQRCKPLLQQIYEDLNSGKLADAFDFDPRQAAAPLPRAPQWCDASAFLNHIQLMEKAFNTDPIPDADTIPLMYQGASDDFLGPFDDIVLPDESHGIDFEGEFGVIVSHVPMSCPAEHAQQHIALLVQINDVSLRAFGARELRAGFGFLHAKPSSSFAPVAITPDELGDAWSDARVKLPLHIEYNGEWFGQPNGAEMNFGFNQLIAHVALTRKLTAGTIIGSGTVSNAKREAGSACIAERRAIELIDQGASKTPFMRFGDRVRMQATAADGSAPFGVIDQRVVQAPASQDTL